MAFTVYPSLHQCQQLGDFSQVEEAYTSALKVLPPSAKADTEDYSTLQQSLSEFFVDLGLYSAARTMFESLLTSREEMYKDHCTILYHHFNHSRRVVCNHPAVIDVSIDYYLLCIKCLISGKK